ncbi:Uncharacterised protein [Serratia fonticola]|uniref:Uncharacterized protein n=1 Tax=Serratia fonticola TaxID=47917 RepID=A0A448SP51_SERFO|nr:hypothetical protein [Serratia fonticola]CAI1821040.1 Uncharacterised protein [Serratia fonticola]VEI69457.1 Uncharacterised protein [Serratia fonticola]
MSSISIKFIDEPRVKSNIEKVDIIESLKEKIPNHISFFHHSTRPGYAPDEVSFHEIFITGSKDDDEMKGLFSLVIKDLKDNEELARRGVTIIDSSGHNLPLADDIVTISFIKAVRL